MKKLCYAAMLAALTVSCSHKPTLTIQGTLADTTGMNGKMAYLKNMANDLAIDSCIVSDGKFTFTTGIDSLQVVIIELDYLSADVIAETGTINLNIVDDRSYDVSGTPLNDQLNAFNREMTVAGDQISAETRNIVSDSTLTTDEKYGKISALYKLSNDIVDRYFEINKGNSMGIVVGSYLSLSSMSSTQIDSLMNVMVPSVKNFSYFINHRNVAFNKETVTTGVLFIDFDGVDAEGKSLKFSDYVGKGNYVLADFWASWCGPCRQSIPAIKGIYEKYKEKGVVVLGVDVWDRKDAFDKAVSDLEIPWPQICLFDNSDAVTNSYGINSIPTLILFAPDGKIVARDIQADEVNKILAEIYGL